MSPKQVLINVKNGNIVKKAEDLLTARYELPELSMKIMSTLIAMLRTDDTELAELYVLRVADWKELTGRTGRDVYKDIDKATTALMSNPIKILRPNDGFLKVNWLSEAEWVPGTGEMELRVSPKLKPYLLELRERFVEYGIENILPLKSSYVIRLYEILKHEFRKVSMYNGQDKVIYEMSVQELRDKFNIPNSYRYNDIKKHITDKAQKQFKEKTDIQFQYKEIKRGRAVNKIEFVISSNTKGSNDYMRDEKSFIDYMRKNFVNRTIVETKDKYTKADIRLAISQDGKLYDKNSIDDFTASRAKEMWSTLYSLAKKDQLKIKDK